MNGQFEVMISKNQDFYKLVQNLLSKLLNYYLGAIFWIFYIYRKFTIN